MVTMTRHAGEQTFFWADDTSQQFTVISAPNSRKSGSLRGVQLEQVGEEWGLPTCVAPRKMCGWLHQ